MRFTRMMGLWPLLVALVAAGVPLADGVAQDTTRPARKVRISAYPYVFSTPEAGPALGVGGIVTFYTSSTDTVLRPSKVTAGGWYSLNDQYKITVTPVLYLQSNRWQISAPMDYGRFTDRFWGIGNQTEEFPEDTTTGAPAAPYNTQATNVKLDIQAPAPFGIFDRAGVVLELARTTILDTLTNPLIDSTLLGSQGGETLGAGLTVVRDTRNSTFFPTAGTLFQARLLVYPLIYFADYQYGRLEVDARQFFGRSENEVLALQIYGNFITGSPPFYALSALGGASRMRGYFLGRYRDRHYVMAQAEYRRMVWWRLGFAAFAGAGEVFGSEGSEFQFDRLQYSLGGGLRVLFNRAERVNLRVDFGVGKGTTGLYFQLEEAF